MTEAVFLIEFGALILILSLLGRLAGRIGLSAIPFYLLGGLLVGAGFPFSLGEDIENFTEFGASLGVILLLFMLGLEYTQEELFTGLRRDYPSGVVDIVLNATPGLVFGLVAGWGFVTALALAGITYISSSGVVSKLLVELGRVANRETPAILSVLVIEDLAMAAYLPLLTALLVGGSGLDLVTGLLVSAVLITLALVVARRYGETLSAAIYDRSGEVVLLTVLGLTVLVAGLAEAVHLSAAVAAFLVGIALSGDVAERTLVLMEPLRDLFAALFFVAIGLGTDVSEIPGVIGWAALLGLITAATKLVTGWYAAARAGVGVRGRVRAGTALVARGEFSIVIATLAIAAGAQAVLGPLTTTYVILLAVFGPVLTRFSEPIADRILGRPSRPSRRVPSWLPTRTRGETR